jgi:putative RNA 2'-phosphotransferase
MSQQRALIRLSKLTAYALGRKPDEFGLIPDPDGFIKIKEFLKALHEEEGFKYVRRLHIEEILISRTDPPVEIKGNLIRATDRDKLPPQIPAQNLPGLLYTCVRRKAYPVVLEKGIFSASCHRIVLSADRDLAVRIGKRIDPAPVLLTVQTDKSTQAGTIFSSAGDTLFLAESIPNDCFTGPPLPKQKHVAAKHEAPAAYKAPEHAGSFLIDLQAQTDRPKAIDRKKKNKDIVWGKEAKTGKKRKMKKQPPPWRE